MKHTSLLLFLLLIAGPASADLKKGPYLQRVNTGGVTVMWETQANTNGYVSVTGGAQEIIANSAAKGTLHQAVVTGLEAGKQYNYSLFIDGKDSGAKGQFNTDPGPTKSFRFLLYGDNRTQHAQHKKVIAAMSNEQDVAFVLNTGDMVSSGHNESHWQTFFDIESAMLAHWPLFATVGNHEESSGKADNFVKYTAVPAGGSDTYYSFKYANTLFIVLDGHVEIDNPIVCLIAQQIAEDCFNAKQMTWLDGELTKAQKDATVDHVLISTHIGPYSSKPGRTGSAQMRALLNKLKANKVKVVLSGHDHYYEHGISGNGLHYVITGGGGAPLYETKPELSLLYPHEVLVSNSIHNYLVVTVAGQWVEIIAKDLDGNILDSFEIGTEPACITAQDCKNEKAGPCEGQWTCTLGYQCQWLCDQAPACDKGSDCTGPQPAGTCEGEWTCINGGCQWDCAQVGECSSDADCANKKPLIQCDGSYYKCDAQVCEFYCPQGSSSGGGTANATGDDPVDPTAGTTDQSATGDQPAANEPASSSGCHHGPLHSEQGGLWLLILLAAALFIARRSRRRNS